MVAKVIQKFFIASMLMWIAPIAILYGFNHNLFPGFIVNEVLFHASIPFGFHCMIPMFTIPSYLGSAQMSTYSLTLLSGFLAVISVNIIIAFYIYLAMKEPSNEHIPDPKFLAEAKASINQSTPTETEGSSQSRDKQE